MGRLNTLKPWYTLYVQMSEPFSTHTSQEVLLCTSLLYAPPIFMCCLGGTLSELRLRVSQPVRGPSKVSWHWASDPLDKLSTVRTLSALSTSGSTPCPCRSTARARHPAPQAEGFDHRPDFSAPMVHIPISALMTPPHLSLALLAYPTWIQGLLQWNGISCGVPILQQSRLQLCKRLAWADAAPIAERASCRPP